MYVPVKFIPGLSCGLCGILGLNEQSRPLQAYLNANNHTKNQSNNCLTSPQLVSSWVGYIALFYGPS